MPVGWRPESGRIMTLRFGVTLLKQSVTCPDYRAEKFRHFPTGVISMTEKKIPAVPKPNADLSKPCLLRFGNFTLDLERHGLFDGDRRVRLTSRPFETLVVLVEHRGQIIQKQVLLDAVWKDAFVTEDSLVKAVREIRRALDDEKTNPQFIQTVSGEGYRFIAEVTRVEPSAGSVATP